MVDMATGMDTVLTVTTAMGMATVTGMVTTPIGMMVIGTMVTDTATVAGGAVAGMAMASAIAGAGLRMATSGFATDPGASSYSFQERRRLRAGPFS
jgi:hypothetical protein